MDEMTTRRKNYEKKRMLGLRSLGKRKSKLTKTKLESVYDSLESKMAAPQP